MKLHEIEDNPYDYFIQELEDKMSKYGIDIWCPGHAEAHADSMASIKCKLKFVARRTGKMGIWPADFDLNIFSVSHLEFENLDFSQGFSNFPTRIGDLKIERCKISAITKELADRVGGELDIVATPAAIPNMSEVWEDLNSSPVGTIWIDDMGGMTLVKITWEPDFFTVVDETGSKRQNMQFEDVFALQDYLVNHRVPQLQKLLG